MRANTGYDLKSFSTDESSALAKLGDFISQSELTAAAEALHTARTVYLFGNTSDHPALEMLSRRLMRLGKAVVTLGVTAKDIAEHLVSFDSSSALVAFALREASAAAAAHRVRGAAPRRGHHLDHRRPGLSLPARTLAPAGVATSQRFGVQHAADPDRALLRAATGDLPPRSVAVPGGPGHDRRPDPAVGRHGRDPAADVKRPGWQAALSAQAALTQACWVGIRLMTGYRALERGADAFALGVIAASFAVPALVTSMPLGRIADRWGGARLSFVGIGVAFGGAMGVLLMPGLWWLIASSALVGLGHIAIMIGQQTLVAATEPRRIGRRRLRQPDRRRFGRSADRAASRHHRCGVGAVLGAEPATTDTTSGIIASSVFLILALPMFIVLHRVAVAPRAAARSDHRTTATDTDAGPVAVAGRQRRRPGHRRSALRVHSRLGGRSGDQRADGRRAARRTRDRFGCHPHRAVRDWCRSSVGGP